MNHKFFDVSKEKQDRIINAALLVFAQNGYRHAGTDEVVRRACISKGLLFHYFESKLGLYVFLYDYAVRFMLLELSGAVDKTESDLFVLIRLIEEASLRACRQYPCMKAFLDSVQEEDCREALQAVAQQREQYEKRLADIVKQADVRLLRPNADERRILHVMEYTFRGLTREHCRREDFLPEELFGEIFSYLRLFERLFSSLRENARLLLICSFCRPGPQDSRPSASACRAVPRLWRFSSPRPCCGSRIFR